MDDKLARHLLLNNYLKRQKNAEDRLALLEKLGLSAQNVTAVTFAPTTNNNGSCCVFYPVPAAFSGQVFGTVSGLGAITHDDTDGVLFARDIITLPHWVQMNDGLTTTQYQTIQKIIIPPNNSIYAANLGHGDLTKSFLARSEGAGQPWTVLLDVAAMNAITGHVNSFVVQIAFNPEQPEDVLVLLGYSGSNALVYRGGGNDFGADFTQTLAFSFDFGSAFCDISFGANEWLFTNGFFAVLNSGTTAVVRSGTIASSTSRHTRGGVLGDTVHWIDTSMGGTLLALGTNNDTTITNGVGDTDLYGTFLFIEDYLACDATGQILMANDASLNPVQSLDGGHTWNPISGLPSGHFIYFTYVDSAGASTRWIAAVSTSVGAGGVWIYYSDDNGATWADKTSDMADITGSTVALDVIKPVRVFEKVCIELQSKQQSFEVSLSLTDPLSIHIEGGIIPTLTGYIWFPTTDPDISIATHIPATGVRIVGFEIDSSGTLTLVDGVIHTLTETPDVSWLPLADTGNVMLCFVILYEGTEFLCDFDLIILAPFPINYATLDMGYQINHAPAGSPVSADKFGFYSVGDGQLEYIAWEDLIALINSEISVTYIYQRLIYETHVPNKNINAPTINIEGALAIATGVGGAWVAPEDGVIQDIVVYCDDAGSAGATIIDVNKNGTTIFTTSGNRPTFDHTDTSPVESVAPDVVDFVKGDVFTFDIDAVATGASDLTISPILYGYEDMEFVTDDDGNPLTEDAEVEMA